MDENVDFWTDPFTESDHFTSPPLTDEMIQSAKQSVGYKLPEAYLRLLQIKNGGELRRSCFPTDVPTSWAKDHVEILAISGIGGKWGIDGELGTRYLVAEWGYPDVGILVGHCPSGGHDVIMLDYSECGRDGEPRVIHVETETMDEPEILVLAPTFESFLLGLVESSQFK